MERKEAIAVLECLALEMNAILAGIPKSEAAADQIKRCIDAYDMAISAIRQQEHFRDITKKVEPLTLEELRKMDGEPVWCEIYIKGQSSFYGIVHGENVTGFIPGDDKPSNLAITNVGAYGLAWLAYRQKPEEDGNA